VRRFRGFARLTKSPQRRARTAPHPSGHPDRCAALTRSGAQIWEFNASSRKEWQRTKSRNNEDRTPAPLWRVFGSIRNPAYEPRAESGT